MGTVPKPAGIKIRIRCPRRNSSWAPQLTVPKKEFILGTATYGAQEGIHLGHRNLRCPRRAWSWGKIQNFIHVLSEIGNASPHRHLQLQNLKDDSGLGHEPGGSLE